MNKLLSICIPTRNRAKMLRGCLDVLVPQAARKRVPIYVSDEASTDETQYVLDQYRQIYDLFFVQTHKQSLGIDDGNWITSVRMAKSKFVWSFSDDDLIEEGLSLIHI